MNEEELQAFINAQHESWDNRADDLIQSYEDAAALVADRIGRALRDLSTKGKLDNSVKNQVSAMAQTESVVNSVFDKGDMNRVITDYIKLIREIFEYTKELQLQLNGETLLEKRFIGEVAQLEVYFDSVLRGAASAGAIITPLKQQVLGAMVRQVSLTELEKLLMDYLIGDNNTLGIYPSYASRIARDLLYQANGLLNNKVAIEIGANAFRYVGSLKPGKRKKLKSGKLSKNITNESRPQCKRWVGMSVLRFSVMDSELSWAYRNGSGMINGTVLSNFSIYRAGWNCRHEAIPILIKSE